MTKHLKSTWKQLHAKKKKKKSFSSYFLCSSSEVWDFWAYSSFSWAPDVFSSFKVLSERSNSDVPTCLDSFFFFFFFFYGGGGEKRKEDCKVLVLLIQLWPVDTCIHVIYTAYEHIYHLHLFQAQYKCTYTSQTSFETEAVQLLSVLCIMPKDLLSWALSCVQTTDRIHDTWQAEMNTYVIQVSPKQKIFKR